jgi:hypothetical protein
MRTWILVVIGAALPLVVGGALGSITTSEGKHTWAYPVQPTAFLLLSVGLAVSHALVLLGYTEVSRRTHGVASTLARTGALGTVLITGCELWSGLAAKADLDSSTVTALDVAYAVSSVVIVVGTLGCGLVLRRSGSTFATPLVVNGAFLVVATLLKNFASDGVGIAALTIWSLLYVWLALRIRSASNEAVHSAAAGSPAMS